MAKKTSYNNKNGNLSVENFIKLIDSGEMDSWMRGHRVSDDPCPPTSLLDEKTKCFKCVDCQRSCISKVKEYKGYYKIGNKKYLKSELGE